MKVLSVLLTVALLLGADQLASRLKRAGALPASSRQTLRDSKPNPQQAGLRTLDSSMKNTF